MLALNCHVRRDVSGLSYEQVVAAGPKPRLARELAHVLDVRVGDVVLATDSRRPDHVLVGSVTGTYRYRPDLDDEHPHVCEMDWQGVRRRADLLAVGVAFPGITVAAIAPLELPAEALVQPAAPPPRPVARRVSPAPSSSGRTCGEAALARVQRRLGRPASWRDPEPEPVVPCDHPRGRCSAHTVHRYWLEVRLPDSDPHGPNVVVVGANPTCPDEAAADNTTFARVRALGEELRAASMAMVNLATRRTSDLKLLRRLPATERVGPRQEPMLREAFARADLVVLASGAEADRLLPAERATVDRLLREEVARGLVVVEPVLRSRHPMTWPIRRIAGGPSVLLQSLCWWPAA